jgi:hypothetical protein
MWAVSINPKRNPVPVISGPNSPFPYLLAIAALSVSVDLNLTCSEYFR